MRATDFLIIYFALGAPFAVYAITRRQPLTNVSVIPTIFARSFFWPLSATVWFVKWMIADPAVAQYSKEERIDHLRVRIEAMAFGGRSTPATFEFRNMLERYAGLTLSLDSGTPYSHPMLALRRHTSKASAACIYRRESRRVTFHQQKARREFLDFVRSLHAIHPECDAIGTASELADLLGDTATLKELTKGTASSAGNFKPANQIARSTAR
jgi:hypothetical protein